MKKTILFILHCLLITSSIFAQDKSRKIQTHEVSILTAGMPLPGTSRITPRTEQFVMYVINDGKKQLGGILTRTIEISEQDGAAIIRVNQRYESPNGTSTDTSVIRRHNLEPLSYQAELTNQKESFLFSPEKVQGTISPEKGEIQNLTESLKEPVFNAVIESEIIQSLPLKAGYAVSIKMYNPGKLFLNPTFRVVRSENLRIVDEKTIETWVVEMQNALVPTTLWVSKGKQELIMLRASLKSNSEFWKVKLYSPESKVRVAVLGNFDLARFPVKPEIFIDRFQGAEGITFNGEGRANNAIWLAEPSGTVRKIADVHRHLGQAGIGRRDILAADFGPKNVFEHGPNDDGIVWRITPEGKKTVVVTGIADPNAILVLKDGTFLVSDDGTDKIYRVKGNAVSIWSTAVPYPNGMALSLDGRSLYVAQIFGSLKPIVVDDRIWAFRLDKRSPIGPPIVAARTGEGGVDGLVADEFGRIYIADNGAGKIWRFDPISNKMLLIAEGLTGVASLVFGEGNFDREAIYATSTRRGGGVIWKVPVGVKGARVYR